jgi:hypothetical protein
LVAGAGLVLAAFHRVTTFTTINWVNGETEFIQHAGTNINVMFSESPIDEIH